LAIEMCAQLQDSSGQLCVSERCRYAGCGELFAREAHRSRTAILPKPGPKSKLLIVAEQWARGEGDFAQTEDDDAGGSAE
jgi:hypothetical protein